MLPTYLELFAATSHLSLKVEKTSWHQLEGKIAVQGRFKLYVRSTMTPVSYPIQDLYASF